MIFGTELDMRTAIRAGLITQKDIIPCGVANVPRMGLDAKTPLAIMPTTPVQMFAGWEEADYVALDNMLNQLPSRSWLTGGFRSHVVAPPRATPEQLTTGEGCANVAALRLELSPEVKARLAKERLEADARRRRGSDFFPAKVVRKCSST